MTHRVRNPFIVAGAVLTTALISATSVHATVPNERDTPSNGGGGNSDRIAFLDGNVSTSASQEIVVPNSSGLAVAYDPPTCDYYKWEQTKNQVVTAETITVTDVDGNETEEPVIETRAQWQLTRDVASDGSYEYFEVAAEGIFPDSDLAEQFDNPLPAPPGGWVDPWGGFNNLGVIFAPIEDLTRRFRVRCKLPELARPTGELAAGARFDPDNPVDPNRYDGQFVDIDPNDALWGLNARFIELFADFDIIDPEVVAPDVVDQWGGLVVRSPAWLGIEPRAWQPQSDTVPHLGFTLGLIAQPTALDYRIAFTPLDDKDRDLASVTLLDCVGPGIDRYATTGQVLPAAPRDLAEFDEPGRTGPCAWTPPARGCVGITPIITYTVYRTIDGAGELYQTHQEPGDTTSFYVGELRAVNVNDASRPRVPDIPNCN